jgi:hypothetical protein
VERRRHPPARPHDRPHERPHLGHPDRQRRLQRHALGGRRRRSATGHRLRRPRDPRPDPGRHRRAAGRLPRRLRLDDGVVIPVKDATTAPTCSLVPGRGNGSRNFDGNPDTPDTFPPGISVDPITCELSGKIDSKLRYGSYAWITTIEQSGTKAYLPYCAPQDVQAGTAYGVERQDGGVDTTLAPGHLVFDLEASNPPTFTFGTATPDPIVTVTYNQTCAGSCFYAYVFSYNALSAAASVSANPHQKFPAMGFGGFTHAIRVTETDETFLRNYGKRAFVTNIAFDYCIAQNDQDCGNNETDPAAKRALIQANGGNSNYEFGLIVLPKN